MKEELEKRIILLDFQISVLHFPIKFSNMIVGKQILEYFPQ